MAYEHKINTGTIFRNKDYDSKGSLDDPNNYSGNMTANIACEHCGKATLVKARLYPKQPKDLEKQSYTRVSFYKPGEPKQSQSPYGQPKVNSWQEKESQTWQKKEKDTESFTDPSTAAPTDELPF